MARKVNPEDAPFSTEMADLEKLPTVDAPEEEDAAQAPSTEEAASQTAEEQAPSAVEEETASVRRSRRAKDKPAVNLDDFEEFRKWKSEADRRIAEERKRREELERKLQEQQAAVIGATAEAKRREIARRLEEDIDIEPTEKQRLLDEYARIMWEQNQAQLAHWRAEKKRLLEEYQLDPNDERFDDTRYADDPNTAWFRLERDVAKAAAEAAAAKAREAQQQLADLPKLVRAEVARIATRSGLATPDLGDEEGGGGFDPEQWERDARLVQLGRMSPEQYLKKWRR
jgi:hypothetical protein